MKLNIKYPTVRVIYDRRKTAREDALATIEVEVSLGRQRKWISTGVRVLPHQWHPEHMVVHHPDNFSLRLKVETVKKNVQDFINLCMINKEEFSFQRLKEALAKEKFDGSFIDYVTERIAERQDIASGTRRNHTKIISALKSFGKIRLFSELTKQNIIDFDQWLHGKGYKQITIHSYHKFMKIYLRMAMLQDLVSEDPYEGLKIKEGKTAIRKYLTEDEIMKIRDCNSLTDSLSRVRDLFMFQFYTGVAYADMCRFDFNKVVERGGKHVLHAARVKTGEPYYIVIIPQALDILKKYDYKLPLMTNEQYNLRLKAVADIAGVKKRVSSHMARHSFAVQALNNGIQMEVVSRMLGHASVRSTMGYAKIVNKTVESAFDKLQQSLDSKG